MMSNNKYAFKANSMIPTQINPNMKKVVLNETKPVSVNPNVEKTEHNNNYPIIIIPGVMGSRLFFILTTLI